MREANKETREGPDMVNEAPLLEITFIGSARDPGSLRGGSLRFNEEMMATMLTNTYESADKQVEQL